MKPESRTIDPDAPANCEPARRLEEIGCIFCSQASDVVVLRENGYPLRRCAGCGLLYVSPRPTAQETVNLYAHDLSHQPVKTHLKGADLKRRYARHHLRWIGKYVRKGSLLEIGAGGGVFLDEARKTGFEPYALELNAAQVDHIRDTLGIPCEQSVLADSAFRNRRFDVLYHCDVLSHLPDPIGEFRRFHDCLSDGGLLVFETGNLPDVAPRYYSLFRHLQLPDHLFFFGRQHLDMLLRRTGFVPERIVPFGIAPQLLFLRGTRNWMRRSPWTRRGHNLLQYLLRYRLGRLTVRRHTPKTLLVFARRAPN